MTITTIRTNTPHLRPTGITRPYQGDQSFAALLENQGLVAETRQPQGTPADDKITPQQATDQQAQALIPLGEINAASPSVSHLLQKHPELRHECWDIIMAPANQGKPFTSLRPGMEVSMNPLSKEIVFGPFAACRPLPPADAPHSAIIAHDGKIVLGTITSDTPTISHLLTQDPRFAREAWETIFAPANQGKPYGSLPPGTVVSINARTKELSFAAPDHARATEPAITAQAVAGQTEVMTATADPEQREFGERLAKSVRSYLGQPYQSIDCYGLVVRGLKDQGVEYGGERGLRQQLERLAKEQGLPTNAFQNGEGLIDIAGHTLYDQSFARVTHAEQQTREVLNRLEPLLLEGMLLSFSTPSRGHTGVVAKKEGQWTYVNSGMIDHQVNGGQVSKRVGEETLAEEIKNWLLLAQNKGTSLQVSAGLFAPKKLPLKAGLTATNQQHNLPPVVKGDGQELGTT